MLSTIFLKQLLETRCRAPHDLKLAQAFKSQGTTRAVIDFVANLGVCMTDSERNNREMVYVRSRDDKKLLPSGMFPIAVAWDNNEVKPSMDITPGTPHVSFIGATAVGVLPDQTQLPNLSSRKDLLRRKDVKVEMTVKGVDREDDALAFEWFERSLFIASWRAWDRRKDKTETCFDFEMRQVMVTPERKTQQVINLFLQQGSTKQYHDCLHAIDRIRQILGGTEGRDPAPTVIVGDEETYRFMHFIRTGDPDRNSWMRELPGDWHVMFHSGKAVNIR